MTEFAADDRDAIRARMDEIEAERKKRWEKPASNLCDCGHDGTQTSFLGGQVCSACYKPKLGVL